MNRCSLFLASALSLLLGLPAAADEGVCARLEALMAVVVDANEPDSLRYMQAIDEAMALATEEGQDSLVAQCLFDKATFLSHRYGSEHGAATLDELREFVERTGAGRKLLYDGWLNMVLAMQNEGRMIFAVAEVQKMLGHAQRHESDYGMATAYTTFGSLYENSYDAAMRNLGHAIDHYRRGGYVSDLYFTYFIMAHVASMHKHPEQVLSIVDTLRTLPEQEKNAVLMDNLALQAYLDLGKHDEAARCYNRLDAMWRGGEVTDDYEDLTVEAMVRYICACGNPDDALPLLDHVAKGNNTSRLHIELEYYTAKGDFRSAFDVMQRLRDQEKQGMSDLQEAELASANAFFNNNVLEAEKQQLVIDNMETRNRLNLAIIVFMSLTVALLAYFVYNMRRKNRIIVEQSEKVKASEAMKTAFIQSMSHEIRTPLNHITGFAALLAQDGFGSEEREQFKQYVDEGTTSLTHIVDNMLEMAQIITSSDKPETSDTDIAALCRSLFDEVKSHTAKPLGFTIDAPEQCWLKTNGSYLRKVVGNLLENAVKFTDSGSVTLAVTAPQAMFPASGEKVRISVADTGIGIPRDKQEWVFERFAKIDSFVPGVGIGLYLCRHIITRLGGTIAVDSTYSSGCRIVVELPVE